MIYHVCYVTVLQYVIYFPHFVFWRCLTLYVFWVCVIWDTPHALFYRLCYKANLAEISLMKPLLFEMKVWSLPKWLARCTNGWDFAIFLSGWYTNGHININSIFSPFRYFQTCFIISGTFLIFTRQEWGLRGCRLGQKKMKSATRTQHFLRKWGVTSRVFFSFLFLMQ